MPAVVFARFIHANKVVEFHGGAHIIITDRTAHIVAFHRKLFHQNPILFRGHLSLAGLMFQVGDALLLVIELDLMAKDAIL